MKIKDLIKEYCDNGANITIDDNSSFDYILDKLITAASTTDDKYDSAKLYGSGDFMFSILRYIIINPAYGNLKPCAIDIMASDYDFAVHDEYVLAIDSNLEINIQNAWNGDRPFANEAKLAIICESMSDEILRQVFIDSCPIIIISP